MNIWAFVSPISQSSCLTVIWEYIKWMLTVGQFIKIKPSELGPGG
jgi:hypothetical protein